MIFASKERAVEVANELNRRWGHPKPKVVLTAHGWTVIASYEFGVSNGS